MDCRNCDVVSGKGEPCLSVAGGVDCRSCDAGVSSDIGGTRVAAGVSCGAGVLRDFALVLDLGAARGFGVARPSPADGCSSGATSDLFLFLALGVGGSSTDALLDMELRDAMLLRFAGVTRPVERLVSR